MSYSEKIKMLRNEMLISQSELALLLGVSIVTVNRWENNKFNPTIKIKRKLNLLFKEYLEKNIEHHDYNTKMKDY